jgi:hypothetical protein
MRDSAAGWATPASPPRAAVKDLLYVLASALSIFAPIKNNAIARLERFLGAPTPPRSRTLSKPHVVRDTG